MDALRSKELTDLNVYLQNGMTPLQQAAFKAKVDICHLLLAHGADVNSSEHNQGYTALMFAALSGMQYACTCTHATHHAHVHVPSTH